MKKLRFVFVDSVAAEDIVSSRVLQSIEFDQGQRLAELLEGMAAFTQLSSRTFVIDAPSGVFILGREGAKNDFVVIDLESAPIFTGVTSKDALMKFQKILRFARRRWAKSSPGHNERLLTGSTKAVIFPYPITTQSLVRITVELAPDRERREKRSRGIEMLVYRIGTDEGGGPQEISPIASFRKAIDELADATVELKKRIHENRPASQIAVSALNITALDSTTPKNGIAGCSRADWEQYLTSPQKDFIHRELTTPHRIEGPAGTGKTLSLVLKAINGYESAVNASREHRALFVAHSETTRKSIIEMFAPDLPGIAEQSPEDLAVQSVRVTTLHRLCADLLRYEVSESELLDADAFESKQSQVLYAIESLDDALTNHLRSHRALMSASYLNFLETTDKWVIAEMLRHEISVVIKGRAGFELGRYKKLPKLTYGLPIEIEGDKAFTFLIFTLYQERLQSSGQFDTDDIVLSALQQLDSPIWRRRRIKEGFDSIYVDETHLFNLNELSVFHRLTRSTSNFPIAYSADISQSIGDRGWSELSIGNALSSNRDASSELDQHTTFRAIFRSSPDIVNLALCITSAGATLFTNFDNPMVASASAFTESEERKCASPAYLFFPSDEDMLRGAFALAETYSLEMKSTRGDVAIIVFGDELFAVAERVARSLNKPVEFVKNRGDSDIVRRAKASGRYVMATPDHVGGLEFDGVILVGVDKGRVPPVATNVSFDSSNFVSYATHQRLYVAVTRARYRVGILGVSSRGESEILVSAISNGFLSRTDAAARPSQPE